MDSGYTQSDHDVGSATSSDQVESLQVGIGLAVPKAHTTATTPSLSDSKGHVKPRLEVRRAVGECQNSSSLPRQGMTNPGHPSASVQQGLAGTNTWDAKGPARKILTNSCDISESSETESLSTLLSGDGNKNSACSEGNAAKIFQNRSDQPANEQQRRENYKAPLDGAIGLQTDGSTPSKQEVHAGVEPVDAQNKTLESAVKTYTLLQRQINDSEFLDEWLKLYEGHILALHSQVKIQQLMTTSSVNTRRKRLQDGQKCGNTYEKSSGIH